MPSDPLLSVRDLRVAVKLREGRFNALNGISFDVPRERTLGLVGESGCGKSMTARAVLRILPPAAAITAGAILLRTPATDTDATAARTQRVRGTSDEQVPPPPPLDLAHLPANSKELRKVRGGQIGMIFQEPMASFSPVHTVGAQIAEEVMLHLGVNKCDARPHILEAMTLAGIPAPETRIDAYPHQLSGGLRQRAMIAMALACRPKLLIADEPTTALDVTVQAQILALLRRLQQKLGMSVLMITHDLGVIAETADDVAVMYFGRIVEKARTSVLFHQPKHPYTRGLLRSVSRIGDGSAHRLQAIPGSVPDPLAPPRGCPFHPRCPDKIPGVCDVGAPPPLVQLGADHSVACHLYTPQPAATAATTGVPT
jgi:peptide/nickel transport system ATP-binding protein